MNIYTKIELLKYVKQFIRKQKPQVAITFLNQLIKSANNTKELRMLNQMVECLKNENSIYKELVIDRINEIIENEKNYPYFECMDNSSNLILG